MRSLLAPGRELPRNGCRAIDVRARHGSLPAGASTSNASRQTGSAEAGACLAFAQQPRHGGAQSLTSSGETGEAACDLTHPAGAAPPLAKW